MSKNQRIIFIGVMCFGMGSIMSFLGNLFSTGFSVTTVKDFLMWWMPTILIAFTYNLLVASKITDAIIDKATEKLSNPEAVLARGGRIRGWSMLTIMCLTMSTWGMLIGGAFAHISILGVLVVWIRSYILAYIVRGTIVKPLAVKVSLFFRENREEEIIL
ncbi:hypothetical protein [Liquorilactobacillus cacaonum]|uniref:DUF2798 domain-containing protein n=1 Tax=Liquorilactobacillus cacaonum DSM 21116 TaxID=1423729 RepID=A0A0R2CGP8_9LACO|nr:hypothetical protein [Liquorilactobacillus cacaonum]KRM90849.1 hypothetical protein FC80_GL000843 [Liquorilactobacillus cacaonum DSM 21116]